MKVLDSKIIVKLKEGRLTQKIGNLEMPVDEYEVAEVIGVGPEIIEGHVSVGDTVYIYTGSGKVVSIEGESFRVITKNEIIIVL